MEKPILFGGRRSTLYTFSSARILQPVEFPFRFASAGSDAILRADGMQAVIRFTLWANAANTWQVQRSKGGVLIPAMPSAGFAFSFLANQGYLDTASYLVQGEEITVIPVLVLEAGDQLILTRGGVGEIVGAVQAVPMEAH